MAIVKRRIGRREKRRMVMPKKLTELATETTETQLAAKVRESANQIWLAGLGALSKTQKEGVKMYEALEAEGKKLQKPTKSHTHERIAQVKAKETRNWDKLE